MSEALPPRVNLEHLKKQAKAMLRKQRGKDSESKLAGVQRTIARKYGFASWARLKAHVENEAPADPLKLARDAFEADDAKVLRELLKTYPQLKEAVNQPVMPFDSPPVICVRSRAMLDVL